MDCTYRLRIPHQAGHLALVALRISELNGLIGDVHTITIARLEAIREITVELRDKDHADQLAVALGELHGVRVVARGEAMLAPAVTSRLLAQFVRRACSQPAR